MSLTPLEALICDLKTCKLAGCGIRLDAQDVELILIELEKNAQQPDGLSVPIPLLLRLAYPPTWEDEENARHDLSTLLKPFLKSEDSQP